MKKNNTGFTLLETLVSLTLLTVLVVGSIYFLLENNKKNNSNQFAGEVIKYINMVDEKSAISGFRSDNWPLKTAEGYEDFKDFMYTNLNAKDSECGKPNGWVPIVDRTNYEADEFLEKNTKEVESIENANKIELLGCNAFKNNYYFDLIPKVRVSVDENNNLVDTVDFIFEFKDVNSLDKDFILVKRAVDEMKASDTEHVSGGHFYTFINKNNIDKDIKAVECFHLSTNCAIKASFKRTGQTDYLRVDGLNSIENNIMTFRVYDNETGEVKSDLVHGVVKNCERWVRENDSWVKKDDQKCGVGIYSDSLVASLIDGNTQVNKTVYLNNQCNTYKLETNFDLDTVPVTFKDTYEAALIRNNETMPCGYYDNAGESDESESEMFILSDITNTDEAFVGGVYKNDNGETVKDSQMTVAPTLDMIQEDFIAKENYDNNPTSLTEEEKEINPSKGLFKKPSRSSVEAVSDPSISTPIENKIRTVKTKDLIVYEDLIATNEHSLNPESSFTLGELEVLNKLTLNKISEISNDSSLSPEEIEERIRSLSYSNIAGSAIVSKNLHATKMIVGDDQLFTYDSENKRFSFRNIKENNEIMNEKNTGTPIDIANKIKQLTASEDIKTDGLAEAKDELKANETFQFVPSEEVVSGASCTEDGIIGADNNYDLFICGNGKWNNLINESGISAFNSETCPAGWRDFTEADGRFLVGSGYFDTIHAGVVRYNVGDKGGEAKHKLLVNEIPSHSHFAPTVEHICSACHYNLGLAKLATGDSYWTKTDSKHNETSEAGGNQAHENRPQYTTVKFCIKGSDDKFDYIEEDTTNPKDNWVEYEVEYTDWYDEGAKYNCVYEQQIDDTDPNNPKKYDVLVCNQDQRRDIKERELNTRTGDIRHTGVMTYENRVIITQEAWQPYDIYYTECEEVSDPYECTDWSPSNDTVLYGQMFTQTRECKIDMQRYKIVRERNWINGSIRNKESTKEMCEPKIEEYYKTSKGSRVEPLTQNISAGTDTVDSRGKTVKYVGAFNLGHSNYSTSAGSLINNELGQSIMIVSEGDNNSCDNKIYTVNGNETTNSFLESDDGASEWLEKYKTITFYKSSGSIYAKYNLSNQDTNGNYSSKRFGSGCNFQSNWYDSPNAIQYFTLDDE